MEITSSLGCVQPSKQQLASPASERWEDWLESTNLVNFQEDELASWFEGNNIFSAQQDVIVQDFYPAPSFELKYGNNLTQNRGGREEKRELLLEELSKSKR